jgi:hypothetical protein
MTENLTALESAKRSGAIGFFGMKMPRPDTYQELVEATAGERFFGVISNIVELIGTSEDPDALVRQLPYDEEEGSIAFILPMAEEQAK